VPVDFLEAPLPETAPETPAATPPIQFQPGGIDFLPAEEIAKSAVNIGVGLPQAVNRLLTNPAVAASSEMGRAAAQQERADQERMQQARYIAGAGPSAGLALIPPEATKQALAYAPTIPGRMLNAFMRQAAMDPGTGVHPPTPQAFGETEAEYEQRKQYPMGAPGEPLYIPQTDNPSDFQKLAMQASTINDLLAIPIGVTRTGGKVLLASMVPGIIGQVNEIATGPGDARDKLEKAKALIIPAAIGVFASRPRGARLFPERLGPEADIGTPVYPPMEFSGAALPGRPAGAIPRGGPAGVGPGYPIVPRAAEPVGPQFPRRGAPIEVPGTAAGPAQTVLEEIRANDARTIPQIQELFPQLTREQARVYRNQVWGAAVSDVGVRVSPAVPRPSPMGPPTPRAEAPPEAPRTPTTEEQIAAREAPEVAARRSALEQQIITWERELEFAQKRGDARAQQAAVDKLLELRRQYEGPQPPAKQPITPKQPVPGVPRGSFPPEVPATAAQPRETVLAEIRRANARTRAEIQKLFPARNLTREEAAALRDQAWGKQPPEEPPAAPPAAPAPKEPTPPAPAAPSAAKPEIATRSTSPNNNPLGDPMGTTYHATPEDWAQWQKLMEQRKALNSDPNKTVQQKFQQGAELSQAIEDLKNKYGGAPPKEPKVGAPPVTGSPDDLVPALKPKEGEVIQGQKGNVHDDIYKAQGDIEGKLLRVGQPEHGFWNSKLKKFQTRDEAAAYLGEKDPLHSERLIELQKKVAPPEPTATPAAAAPPAEAPPAAPEKPSTIGETPLAGKTLGEWEAVKDASQLPRGDARAELAKYLAVPNQPSRILQALANKKRTREIHAPPAEVAPVLSGELALRFGDWGPDGKLHYSNKVIGVPSLEDAARKWNEIREKSGAGASESPVVVVVNTKTGEHVAKVSYNGRLWDAQGKEIQPEPKTAKAEPTAPAEALPPTLASLWTEYDEGGKMTERDLLQHVLNMEPENLPPALARAAAKYRDAVEEDFSMAGRGDVEPAQDRFMAEFEKAAGKEKPKTETKPAEPATPTPVSETKPPVSATPAAGAAKAQAEVSKVAATEGQRPAKDVKQDLIDGLQQALMKAPSKEEIDAVQKPGTKTFDADKWPEDKPKTVTIDIPGDGVFTVPNTIEALSEVLDRARKLKTDAGKPEKVSKKAIKASEGAIRKTAGTTPTPEQPPSDLGPTGGTGPGTPSAEQGPDPVVLDLRTGNPLFNSLQRKYQNFFTGLKQLWTRHPAKLDIMGLSNAANNLPRIYGQQAGNSLRLGATEADLKAATMLMQSLKMSGDGLSVEDAERLGKLEFADDPQGYLRDKESQMFTTAQRFLHQGKKLEAAAALDAHRAYKDAADNFNRLRPLAERARQKFDRQFGREQASGLDTAYENWYVPQRHDLDLFVSPNRPIVLGDSKGGGGAQFRKAKFYEDYASAIEAGWIPRSLNIADLLEHRVASGERMIFNKGFFDQMRSITDPVDQRPVVIDIPRRTIQMPDGTTRSQESIPHGYTKMEVSPGVNVAVHEGYSRLVNALTARSQLAESAVVGTLQDIAAVEKHLMLALDTFHLSRVLQAEFFLTGKVSLGQRQRIGRALVEYSAEDFDRAVKAGELTQEMVDYMRKPQPMEVHGKTVNVSPKNLVMFGARQGLNIGRIGDALYRDWLRNMPITGEINKFVFDKVSRSAIANGFLAEFERVAKANPDLTGAQVAKQVARDINVLFGNLQKESIFRNPSLRSLTQVLFLAPQWVESLARRETRGVLQFGQAAADIPKAISEGRLPRLGTVGKGVGTALAGYFAGTQILNLITRGKFTFQNPEAGHKLDAWIPGGQNGFFISPLSVFGEITHDILRYAETKPDFATAVQQIGMNKLGPLGRFLYVLASGRDPMTAEKLVGTGRRATRAAMTAVPVPITLSQPLRLAGSKLAPGVISPPAPGAVERQGLASIGFKTEPVGTAQSQIYHLAEKWKSQSGNAKYEAEVERRLKEDFGPSDYRDLRSALTRDDPKAARAAYQELRSEGKTPKTIRQTFQHPHPFTGSGQAESAFKRTLSDEDRDLYDRALEERRDLYRKLQEMLQSTEPE